jgi:predicted MFS family arabinose efflux permease
MLPRLDTVMTQSDSASPHYSRGMLRLLAIIAGVSVANIYYNQPLIDSFRTSFPDSAQWIGVVPTATQLGYAAGMLLLAPLGDRVDRRTLILLQIAGLALALICAALAPSLGILALASLAIGVLSTIAQQAVPFAAELAPPAERGHAVGTVMSGLLLGILLARTASGLIAGLFGWRTVFGASVLALAALAAVVVRHLPRSTPTSTLPYGRLLATLWHLTVELRGLREAAGTGALIFGAFSAFWPVLTLLLAGAPFHLGPAVAGLFGVVGAAGALAAPYAGRFADKRGHRDIITCGIALVIASFLIFAASGSSLIGLAIGVVVLDIGVQATQISNQARVYALKPEARSRVNTVYMVSYFIGGSLGAACGTAAWRVAGWTGTCVTGLAFAAGALLLHLRGTRTA